VIFGVEESLVEAGGAQLRTDRSPVGGVLARQAGNVDDWQ
jgi:hypothetical protein